MTPFWAVGQPLAGVRIGADGETPAAFTWDGRAHRVTALVAAWRVHTGWWETEVWRDYYEVTTDSGLLCVLYRDLLSDAWALERIYA